MGTDPLAIRRPTKTNQHFYHLWIHQVACDQLGAGRGTREERPKHGPAQVAKK